MLSGPPASLAASISVRAADDSDGAASSSSPTRAFDSAPTAATARSITTSLSPPHAWLETTMSSGPSSLVLAAATFSLAQPSSVHGRLTLLTLSLALAAEVFIGLMLGWVAQLVFGGMRLAGQAIETIGVHPFLLVNTKLCIYMHSLLYHK